MLSAGRTVDKTVLAKSKHPYLRLLSRAEFSAEVIRAAIR